MGCGCSNTAGAVGDAGKAADADAAPPAVVTAAALPPLVLSVDGPPSPASVRRVDSLSGASSSETMAKPAHGADKDPTCVVAVAMLTIAQHELAMATMTSLPESPDVLCESFRG
jgi:hypothetical protein